MKLDADYFGLASVEISRDSEPLGVLISYLRFLENDRTRKVSARKILEAARIPTAI